MKSASPSTPDAIWASAERALAADQPFDHVLEQIYDLILPYRKFEESKGQPRMDRVFDSTAVRSAFRFAGRLQLDIVPPFQQFAELRNGVAAKARLSEGELIERQRQLDVVRDTFFATLDVSSFPTSANEMCQDLVAGQGALYFSEGTDDEPFRFDAVPANHIRLVNGPGGRVWEIHYKKKYTIKLALQTWPDAKDWPKRVREADAHRDAAQREAAINQEIDVLQSTVWQPKDKRWVTSVIMPDEDKKLLVQQERTRTCPWLTPRFFVVPGEARGRGPAWLALPDVRVANKTVELTLRAAALAILGIWTRTPDFNSAGQMNMARIRPGTAIPVSRNAGSVAGPSLQVLDIPRNFDVSNLLLQEYREQIRECLFDRAIPRTDGTPRSASEIVESVRLHAEDLAAAYGRLDGEMVRPLINRGLEILFNKGLLPDRLVIDQLITEVHVTSALAQSQSLVKVRVVTQWLEIMSAIMPQEAVMLAAKIEDIGPALGEMLGVPAALMRDRPEAQQLQKLVAEILASQQAEGMEGAA